MSEPIVYVYATDSHTETAIKDFLMKINHEVSWIIRSPYVSKKSKKDYADRAITLTGRTGLKLEDFMLKEINTHPCMLLDCHAILLEDDLDTRDKGIEPQAFLAQAEQRIRKKFQEINPQYSVNLICLYAAPEIETWFIEDWENGFGSKKYALNHKIKTGLKKAIDEIKAQCKQGLEQYCNYFATKLSTCICARIQELSEAYGVNDPAMASYSKRTHGSMLLLQLNPATLNDECRLYFAPAYRKIKDIGK